MTPKAAACYELLNCLNGVELNEVLRHLPLRSLLSFVVMGSNIFHDKFYKLYDQVENMNLQ